MKKKELVSIIVPVYKVEEMLDRCMESILHQSYKNIEVILVDDGSPDRCPILCDEYSKKDKRVKVIHKENGGLSSARNEGLKKATGEYLCFIDSDDYVEKNYVEKLYNEISKNNLDFVVCNYKRIYGEVIQNCEVNNFKIDNFINPSVWNKMYRKSLFKNIKFPDKLYYEDLGTFPMVYCNGKKYKIINDYLYNYAQNINSIMHQTNNKIFDVYKIFELNLDYIKKHKHDDIIKNLETAYIFHVIIGTTYRKARDINFCFADLKKIKNKAKNTFPKWYKNNNIKQLSCFYRIFLILFKYFDILAFILLKLFARRVVFYKQ